MSENLPNKDDELQELLHLDLDEIGDLDLFDEDERLNARKKVIEILKGDSDKGKPVPPGKAEFKQLLESPLALQFEDRLKNQTPETPGPKALLTQLQQISVKDRSHSYKQNIHRQYDLAVKEVQDLFLSLSKGQRMEHTRIKHIVSNFLKIFISDRCILLNLPALNKPTEDYLFNHAVNVCLLTLNIATASGFSENQVLEMGMAGLLADVGMMQIPPSIRRKRGTLSMQEYYEVLKHPILGIHCLEKVLGLQEKISFVSYQHHERLNGVGYPKKRKGRIIHAYSRIVSIADVYQAMASPRSYRAALQPNKAMNNIIKMGRMGLLGIHDVLNFVRFACVYPVGSLVALNSGVIAKVVQPHPTNLEKPTVSVLSDPKGTSLNENNIYQIDLAGEESLEIERPVAFHEFKQDGMTGF